MLSWSPKRFWSVTLREFNLAKQGAYQREQDRRREIAHWISPVISVLAGKPISGEELLGEKTSKEVEKENSAKEQKKAEASIKKLEARMKKNGFASMADFAKRNGGGEYAPMTD